MWGEDKGGEGEWVWGEDRVWKVSGCGGGWVCEGVGVGGGQVWKVSGCSLGQGCGR